MKSSLSCYFRHQWSVVDGWISSCMVQRMHFTNSHSEKLIKLKYETAIAILYYCVSNRSPTQLHQVLNPILNSFTYSGSLFFVDIVLHWSSHSGMWSFDLEATLHSMHFFTFSIQSLGYPYHCYLLHIL